MGWTLGRTVSVMIRKQLCRPDMQRQGKTLTLHVSLTVTMTNIDTCNYDLLKQQQTFVMKINKISLFLWTYFI